MDTLPKFIEVAEFARSTQLNKNDAYAIVRKMPPGIAVKLGRRVRLNFDKLQAWLNAGGSTAVGK